jgi:predicted RNA-binding protein associated with RNAse of E/G family
MIVYKLNEQGETVWQYPAEVLERGPDFVRLEAFFNRDDMDLGFATFKRGDRFVEYFYSDRWYNIFQMHDVDDDHLTGWYCNITRPAVITPDTITADDLALDVFVAPTGAITVLDEDEFAALPLDDTTRARAQRALAELRELVAARHAPFAAIMA